MFINCNPKCKRGTTTASLDVEKNEAVCDHCGDVIAISDFSKENMKRAGDVIKKKEEQQLKPYQYECTTCKKIMPATLVDGKIVGKDCSGECKFNITEYTEKMLKDVLKKTERDDE
jgi:transcription initiation factor TFIIIB Brf1 subunit/transcription initiation factor TFIIB